MLRLSTKVMLAYSAIVLALYGVFFLVASHGVRTVYLSMVEQGLADIGAVVCADVQPLFTNAPAPALQQCARRMGALTQKRVTVVAADGTVLADSESDPTRMENHAGRPEIVRALRGERGTELRLSDTLKEPMLYVAVPLVQDGRVAAVVRTSMHVSTLDAFLDSLRNQMLLIALALAALSLTAIVLVSRRWSRPIALLSKAARDVADGNLDTKVYVDSRDETATLAMSFNDMVAHIKGSRDDLARQKDALNTIIASMREGLLVIQNDGKVTLCNDSFKALAGIETDRGSFYWDSFRTPELLDLVEKVLATQQSAQCETDINGRHLVCNGGFSSGSGHAVITLHDVTDIVAVARMKKDFVTNVSHELRTPLTSIKGFAETLLDATDPERRRYVGIIIRNTDRLVNIVEDLLRLSDLEREDFTLERAPVDLRDLIANVIHMFEKRAAEKGLELSARLPDAVPPVMGDAFKLEQVFTNLIDNAIKYTDKGRVTVSVRAATGVVETMVDDTGIGIPGKDVSRIFERFYVVDKSRSRAQGGTGLGLSIAKHIVLLHGGTIQVQSTVGTGTTFTVRLPLS